MPEAPATRRLAAILAADVIGYSRLMAADEAGTLVALKRHREALFDPTVSANNGRIVKLIGDGTLVEFGSVVDAVNCAMAIQRAIAADPEARKIMLRIGINLGDIIIDGDDIYGDGVNIAARLEPLAEPGGVCVSSIVNESVGSRVDATFDDGGEVQVKNIDRPIRVWKWHPSKSNGGAAVAPVASIPARPKRETPSIAVLPFANMSGDPEQEYFSDGISEDIITDLSKVGGLVVIARNSTFAYKGRHVDIRTVGRDLGVRSVLEGSIRKAGNRVRITAQLIDVPTGGHLWAERYDRDLTDIFAVQDDVTREIVAALKVTLTPSEEARISGGGTTGNGEAHDAVLRARQLLARAFNADVARNAIALLDRAIEIDPDYAQAYAARGMAHFFDFQNRWSASPEASLKAGMADAEMALAKDPEDPFGHYVVGIVVGYLGDRKRAEAELAKALELSPNFTLALNASGVGRIFDGNPEQAIPFIERAIRLDPGGSQQYLHFLGLANLLLGRFETAAALFQERILLVPETDVSRAFYASVLGHLGRIEEARQVWQELKAINPRYDFHQHITERLLFERKQDPELIVAGLAKAGLPD
jgi:adenylate cyclase